MYPKVHERICKVCALLAASLILPTLAIADHDNGKWIKGDRDEHHWGDKGRDQDQDRRIPVVPEANAGLVLVPFFGAVLLFSARYLFGAKARTDNA